MELIVSGNPGTGNSFKEVNLHDVKNYNPAATTVITNNYNDVGYARMRSYFLRLLDEIRGNVKEEVIDDLLYYTTRLDGTKGMEEKLMDGGFRPDKIEEAKHFKELYAKKATRFDCYPAAQQINLNLFSRIKNEFETNISPLIENGESLTLVMQQIRERIVQPIMTLIENAGANDIYLQYTEDHIYGMIYYLTGMCHLNWKDYDNV